jgi:predicted CXXCH cytochrome family protein
LKAIIKNNLLYYLLISLILISSCSSQSSYKVLSTIFDGVPDPESINSKSIDSIKKTNPKSELTNPEIQITSGSVHPPFKERACNKCHKGGGPGQLKIMPELCYSCHKDFAAQGTFVHGPINGGYCNECHVPHNSKFEKLLLNDGQDLCFKCHSKEDVLSNEKHSKIDSTKCWKCHNPHVEKNKYMLKKL